MVTKKKQSKSLKSGLSKVKESKYRETIHILTDKLKLALETDEQLRNHLKMSDDNLQDLGSRFHTLEDNYNKLVGDYTTYKGQNNELNNTITRLESENKNLQEKINGLEYEKEFTTPEPDEIICESVGECNCRIALGTNIWNLLKDYRQGAFVLAGCLAYQEGFNTKFYNNGRRLKLPNGVNADFLMDSDLVLTGEKKFKPRAGYDSVDVEGLQKWLLQNFNTLIEHVSREVQLRKIANGY